MLKMFSCYIFQVNRLDNKMDQCLYMLNMLIKRKDTPVNVTVNGGSKEEEV
jgi:hypothetical protein